MGVSVHKEQNWTHTDNSIYSTFKQQLIKDGTIKWRQHCRFYKEHLYQNSRNLYNITSSTDIHCRVKESLPTLNNPVVVLETPMQTGTTKLSVISEHSLAVVHLNFHSCTCFANYQNGEYNASLMKKKVPKSISIQQHHSVCWHIQNLFGNKEILKNLFPDCFRSSNLSHDEMENVNYSVSIENTIMCQTS